MTDMPYLNHLKDPFGTVADMLTTNSELLAEIVEMCNPEPSESNDLKVFKGRLIHTILEKLEAKRAILRAEDKVD